MKRRYRVTLRIEELEHRAAPANLLHDLSMPTNLPLKLDDLSAQPLSSPVVFSQAAKTDKVTDIIETRSSDLQLITTRPVDQNGNEMNRPSLASNTDELFRFLNVARTMVQTPNDEETLEPSFGVFPGPSLPSIVVYTGTTTLPEIDEQGDGKPGWYLPVNWGDIDDDGWSPSKDAAPTANSGPVYGGELFDTYIPGPKPHYTGGSNALFKFEVSAGLIPLGVDKDGNVKLTFDTSKIKVWSTNTKKIDGPNSSSSEVASGSIFNWICDMVPNGGKVTLYAEGIAGSSSFKDAFLKAELIDVVNAQPPGAPDVVQVSVFEVTNQGKYGPGPKSEDNDFDFAAHSLSNNTLGKASYVTDPICEYFHNNMEMQGTVKPLVVTGQAYPYNMIIGPSDPLYTVYFDADRWVYGVTWKQRSSDNVWELTEWFLNYEWEHDSISGVGKDVSVSSDSHIYYSDSPGYNANSTSTYKAWIDSNNFKNWFTGSIYSASYQISDIAKWHSQYTLIPNPVDTTKLIRGEADDQKLGDGWIDIPIGAPS